MMMDKSLGDRPKSMLAMTRLAARLEGMPIAIPNSVRASVSRKISQRTLRCCAPSATRTPIPRVRRVTP